MNYAKQTKTVEKQLNLLKCRGLNLEVLSLRTLSKIYSILNTGLRSKSQIAKDFEYTNIKEERPLKENGEVVNDMRVNHKPDPSLRDSKDVPLKEDIEEYFKREVLPHVPDAWIDESKHKVGYKINFTRYFYEYKPLRSLDEIRVDILKLEEETSGAIKQILED